MINKKDIYVSSFKDKKTDNLIKRTVPFQCMLCLKTPKSQRCDSDVLIEGSEEDALLALSCMPQSEIDLIFLNKSNCFL